MCLYVDRFRHVNAYTVHGYFTDPEYRRLRRRLGGFAEEINRLRMRVAKGEMVRPTTPVRAATGVAPGPWWGTAHNGTAWAEVPQAWIDWQLEVVHCPRKRSVLEVEDARRETAIREGPAREEALPSAPSGHRTRRCGVKGTLGSYRRMGCRPDGPAPAPR